MALSRAIEAPDFVASLARGLAVIRAFGPDAHEMTLSEVAQRTGVSRAAARRFLLTLAALGYADSDGKRFRLTARVLDLGYAYLSSMDLWDAALPHMERVVEQARESCSASVLDGGEIVYVARVPTRRIMSVALGIGTRLPAYPTSMGRVLLASLTPERLDAYFRNAALTALTPHTVTDEAELRRILAQVARQGYATVDQELEEGLRSIAAPIRSRSGRTLAAVNVSAHTSRASRQDLVRRFLPLLQEAAGRITAALPR